MTRDTKVGLLLGLVFIFIIAFLINGVPWLRGSRQGATQPSRVTRPQPITPGVVGRDLAQNMLPYNRPVPMNLQGQSGGPDVRSTMTLPVTNPMSGGQQTPTVGIMETPTHMVSSGAPSMPVTAIPTGQPQNSPVVGQNGSPMSANGVMSAAAPVRTPMISGTPTQPATSGNTLSPAASTLLPAPTNPGVQTTNPMMTQGSQSVGTPQPVSPQVVARVASSEWPKSYVVKEGDSLEAIAKRLYGASEGVKPSSIKHIFEANKGTLKSPERLSIGQKLTIPALTGGSTASASVASKPALAVSDVQGQRWYVVREGDSLWKIASSQLGKGTRYQEILKLNATTLKNDEDSLELGMKLRLPAK